MVYFLAGCAVLVFLLVAGRLLGSIDPRKLANAVRKLAGVGALALAGFLIVRGALPPGYVPRPARPGPLRGRVQGTELWQEDFTDAQYEALGRLVAALCGALDVPARAPSERGVLADPAGWQGILGHYHLTTAKIDPGPAFDWDRLLGSVQANPGPAP